MTEHKNNVDRPALSRENAINTNCPWSGDAISSDSLTLYKGRVVGFCNPGCNNKFEAAINAFDKLIG